MSLTQTTTTVTTEAMSDLQRRLQPVVEDLPGAGARLSSQQLRFRGTPLSASSHPHPAKHENAPLARRFSFVWPFISKESTSAPVSSPFLSARCSQLLRQFPAYLSGRRGAQFASGRGLRDTISKGLQQLKTVWLILAVYMTLVVLAGLTAALCYTFWFASKPLGLWFLVACIGATGILASVSFKSRTKTPPALLAQDSRANLH